MLLKNKPRTPLSCPPACFFFFFLYLLFPLLSNWKTMDFKISEDGKGLSAPLNGICKDF